MRDHRSLEAWQEAKSITQQAIGICRHSWRPFARAVFDQFQASALSVRLNIAEGYAFGPGPTFRRHLDIAYGSAVETGELIDILGENELVWAERVGDLRRRNQRCQALLLGLVKRYR